MKDRVINMSNRVLISSTNNPQIKNLALLQKKAKARKEQGLFVVEGIKMLKEAMDAGLLNKIYMSESFYHDKPEASSIFKEYEYEIVTDSVLKQVSDTMTPQGIMGTVNMPTYDINRMLDKDDAFILLLEDIRDPGNLGTIIRTAEGAGVTGIILNASCADILQPKVVRSTMGSIYRVPFYEEADFIGALSWLRLEGFKLFAAHLSGISYDTEGSFLGRCGILIGNEAAGLSWEAASLANNLIKIPMEGKVESLNAAVASAILMYEVARQRRIMKN